jgi:hypothetical protein
MLSPALELVDISVLACGFFVDFVMMRASTAFYCRVGDTSPANLLLRHSKNPSD